jgi:hypothetical protein
LSTSNRAGATALLVAPLLAFVINAMLPTLSDDATAVIDALHSHHGVMVLGLSLEPLSIALMIAGVVWLAVVLRARAPRLATAGGIIGVAGGLIVLFEDGVHAVAPAVVGTLGAGTATKVLDHITTSAAGRVEPLALLLALGLTLLAAAAVRAGAPYWLAFAVGICAFGQGIGEATGIRVLLLTAFAGLFLSLAVMVRALPSDQVAARAQVAPVAEQA